MLSFVCPYCQYYSHITGQPLAKFRGSIEIHELCKKGKGVMCMHLNDPCFSTQSGITTQKYYHNFNTYMATPWKTPGRVLFKVAYKGIFQWGLFSTTKCVCDGALCSSLGRTTSKKRILQILFSKKGCIHFSKHFI